jgi:hypothetical protein
MRAFTCMPAWLLRNAFAKPLLHNSVCAQVKVCAWFGFIFVACAIARRDAKFDLGQCFQTCTFLFVSILTSYIMPTWMKYKAMAAAPASTANTLGAPFQ